MKENYKTTILRSTYGVGLTPTDIINIIEFQCRNSLVVLQKNRALETVRSSVSSHSLRSHCKARRVHVQDPDINDMSILICYLHFPL